MGCLKFRKKPIVVEAFQMTRERRVDNRDWPEWLNAAWSTNSNLVGVVCPNPKDDSFNGTICINTMEGVLEISWDDWIIKGVAGELYPCKPDIFAATYEQVEESVEKPLTLVNSSNIRGYCYEEGTRELMVQFISGARYLYKEVPVSVYHALELSDSKGKFLNSNIKPAFQVERLPD